MIVDVTSNLGIGGMVVSAGGQSGTSTTPNGTFTINGLTPGTYPLVVKATALFQAVPGPVPQVKVVKGQITNVGTVLVIDPAYLPPGS
jgi:hypothetical protein